MCRLPPPWVEVHTQARNSTAGTRARVTHPCSSHSIARSHSHITIKPAVTLAGTPWAMVPTLAAALMAQ